MDDKQFKNILSNATYWGSPLTKTAKLQKRAKIGNSSSLDATTDIDSGTLQGNTIKEITDPYKKELGLTGSWDPDNETKLVLDFQKNPTKEKFDKLYETFSGSFESSINAHGGLNTSIPRSAIKGEALVLFDKALKSYKPGKSKFTTWLHNQMMPLKRYIRENADIAHIPDNRSIHLARVRERMIFLEDELSRPPSTEELADDLRLPVKTVATMMKELKRDLKAEGGLEGFAETDEVKIIEDKAKSLMPDLNGKQQVILERLFGLNGQPKMTIKQISKKLKLPENKVRYEQRLIQNLWQKAYPND